MNFAVYFSITEFLNTLQQPNSVVHIITFRDPKRDKPDDLHGMILLTSDAGVERGTIRACQVIVADKAKDADEALKLAGRAFKVLDAFFLSKGHQTLEGIISTSGLQEGLDHWGFGTSYSIADLEELSQSTKAKSE